MATAALVTAGEYLRMSFEHDAEFVDGRIEERPVGEWDHSNLQRWLVILLGAPEYWTQFLGMPETRLQVSETNFRVPDVMVVPNRAPADGIVRSAPMLCIEILSPEDTLRRTLVKVREYIAMGVPEVWILDPESRTVQVCAGSDIREVSAGLLRIPGTLVELDVARIFGVIDR